jgi:hypothetical protein
MRLVLEADNSTFAFTYVNTAAGVVVVAKHWLPARAKSDVGPVIDDVPVGG